MIDACNRPIRNCHWLRPREFWLYKLSFICNHAAKYEVAPMVTFDQPQSWKAFIIMCTMNSRAVSFTVLFSDLGASLFEWPLWFPLIMEYSGIGYLWWKIYADSTINHTVFGEAYASATKGYLHGTITSNTIMSSRVLITAVTSFLTGVESSDIRDMEITASYWEGPEMPVSTTATDKSAWRSRMWKEHK